MNNILTQELTIANKPIRTVEGLFSLNDLHKASGGNKKHQPANFLRLDTTKGLIAEIEQENINSSDMRSLKTVVKSIGGRNGGSFVCKELVYHYAMWISAKFSLLVIRTFDKLANQQIEQPKLSDLSDSEDRVPLRQAVSQLVTKRGISYSEAYTMVNQRMGTEHLEELSIGQVPQAIEYVHQLILNNVIEGELLPKSEVKQYKTDIRGLTFLKFGAMAQDLQKEKLRKAMALMNEASLLFEDAMKLEGAVYDGYHEAMQYLDDDYSFDDRLKANKKAQDNFDNLRMTKLIF